MLLICPNCKKPLRKENRSAVCENHHTFDYAKQGYLNLLLSQSKGHGDNKEMAIARTNFLNSGAYAFLKEAISTITQNENPNVLIDLGCGEGYYTESMHASDKYGFDLSKDSLKHAARIDSSTHYSVASIFHLPIPDCSADMMVTCFAPFAKDEIERILKPHGSFLFISPGPKHLIEMKELLYETPYLNVVDDLDTTLQLENTTVITNQTTVSNTDLLNLFQMTPYAYKTGINGMKKLQSVDTLELTCQFVLRLYRK